MKSPLIGLAILLLSACSDSIEEPLDPVKVTSHEFTWRVDTLFTASTMSLIWCGTKSDVYVGGRHHDFGDGLWHFNGDHWKPADISPFEFWGYVTSLEGVDSSYFIAIGGYPAKNIMENRHGIWSRLPEQKYINPIQCSDVVSPTEIYIGGKQGLMMYNGIDWSWVLDSTEFEKQIIVQRWFFVRSIRKGKDGILYFVTDNFGSSDYPEMRQLWAYESNNCEILDAYSLLNNNTSKKKYGPWLFRMDDKIYSGNQGVYSYDNRESSMHYEKDGASLAGTDRGNNLFLSNGKKLEHFNGATWQDITPKIILDLEEPYPIRKIGYVENTIFILAWITSSRAIVLRGEQHKN